MDMDTVKRATGLGYSPFEAQLQVTEVWTKPRFEERKDESGKVEMVEIEPEEWVRFKTTSVASMGNELISRMSDIMDVGNNDDPDDKATNIMKARRSAIVAQVHALKSGKNSALEDGAIPLEQWGAIPESTVTYLKKAHNIHSVQQLRNATESVISVMNPGINPHKLRETARAYLDNLAAEQATGAMTAYEKRIKEMEEKLAAQNELIHQLLAERADEGPRKQRGRPPNEVSA